jgi:hypothetical protein
MRIIDSLRVLVTRQTDARPIGIVRAMVGFAAIGFALESWVELGRLISPLVVKMPYVAWLPLLSSAALPVFIGIWLIMAVAFIIGLRTRLAGGILTLVMAYTLLLDQQLYSNHLYLGTLVLLLLTLADSGARFSLDARWSGGHERISGWPILLLKLQVSIVYFFAALLKINPIYLSGSIMTQFWPFNDPSILPGGWSPALIMQIAAVLSICTELFLAVALWVPRLRWLALAVGVGFHLMIICTGGATPGVPDIPFAIFALVTVAPYALFFDFRARRVAVEGYSG